VGGIVVLCGCVLVNLLLNFTYLKDKINELTTYSKNKNIRDIYTGINEFNKDYQTRNNLVDENSHLLADSHIILNRLNNYISQLLNILRVSDIKEREIHTAEPLVLEPTPFEVGTAIAKW
jgi:hypothetical protein